MPEAHSSRVQALKSSLAKMAYRPSGWRALAIFLIILAFSIPSLIWFGRHWTLYVDSTEYLILGGNLISGQGYTQLDGQPYTDRGPILPGLIGFLTLFFGRNTESLAWGIRLLALANSVLSYFLVKRISGPLAGLLAAMLVALFSYTATITEAFNIDAVLLTLYLLALLTLLVAAQSDSRRLAFLSGLLLGTSILTKESAFASLPVALLAALFLGWNLRGVSCHYAGVVLVCLPWWVWVWAVSGEIYLVGSLPTGLRAPAVVAVVGTVGLALGLYASGVVARFLASARRQLWVGWSLVVAWIVLMSGLLLSISVALSDSSFGMVWHYLVDKLAAYTPLWPLLLVAGGYATWKAAQGSPLWQFYAATLAVQLPVCLLVTIEGFSLRQFLVPQVLLLCALAVLVVESCDAAVRRRESRELATNWAIAAVAASLSIVLLLTMVGHVRLLLGEPEKWSSLDRTSRVRPEDVRALRSIRKMDRWMKTNVPEGEKIFVVATYDDYQAFLDGGRHEWASLQFDCKVGRRNLTGNGCVPGEAIAEAPPKPTVWFSMEEDCRAIALSTPTVMKQMEQNNSDYLLVSDQSWYPAILGSVPYLSNSGEFEIAHAERSGEQKRTGSTQAFVLLKRTEEVPHPTPTRMNAETVNRLVECEKSEGSKSAQEVRSKFPNGIALVPTSGRGPESDDEAKINARANKTIKEIFR
jgi:4-amino-4-deoxy-L-arabinose transferase-like glycosyltransferase